MSAGAGWPLLLSEGIRAAANRRADKIAVRVVTDGAVVEQISYGQFVARMNQVSHTALSHWGLQRGDRVAIASNNSLHYMLLVCGLGAVGIITATPNPKLSPREIAEICDDCGARFLFCEAGLAESLRAEAYQTVESLLPMDAALDGLLARAKTGRPSADQFADANADFVLPYTSGTTGRPKGVRVTHISRSLTYYGMGVEYGCFGPDDHFIGLAPLCHGAGFAFNVAPLYFGATCDLMTRFHPEHTIRHLNATQPSGIFMVPTHFRALFAEAPATVDLLRDNRLRSVISNAAALEQDLKEQIVDVFGDDRLHECYGSTEAGVVTSQRPHDQLRKRRCVGLPFVNTEVRLRNAAGAAVEQGEIGELFSRSPYLFAGYWNNPEETSKSLRDGWVSAGDLARQDSDGHYYIVDRKKDMIITGGVNVYPLEIERVLVSHPGIAECAVFGQPDDYWGERVVAALVLDPAITDAPSNQELQAFCAKSLGRLKLPKVFLQVQNLPRNAMGKVTKATLREGTVASTPMD